MKHTLIAQYVSLSIAFIMTKLNAGIDLNRIIRSLLKEMGSHAESAREERASPDVQGRGDRESRRACRGGEGTPDVQGRGDGESHRACRGGEGTPDVQGRGDGESHRACRGGEGQS